MRNLTWNIGLYKSNNGFLGAVPFSFDSISLGANAPNGAAPSEWTAQLSLIFSTTIIYGADGSLPPQNHFSMMEGEIRRNKMSIIDLVHSVALQYIPYVHMSKLNVFHHQPGSFLRKIHSLV